MAKTLKEFAERWERSVLSLWKKSAAKAARSHLKVHIKPVFDSTRVEDIRLPEIQEFVASLTEKGLQPKTVDNVVETLRSMLTKAYDWEDIEKLPKFEKLEMPEQTDGEQRGNVYSEEQVRMILAMSKEPWRTLWLLVAVTGIRCGEALGLCWECVDLPERKIYVRRSWVEGEMGTVKSKNSKRWVPIPDELHDALVVHRMHQRGPNPMGLVFPNQIGRPLRADHVRTRHLHPILRTLGITGSRWGFHAFRHAQATTLVATGADAKTVQAQLGHGDPSLALRLYAHRIPEVQRAAVQKVAQRFTSGLDEMVV